MKKVIGIVGPTAVGKTALSIQLAKQLNGEIISGDALQVYRGLDIGTAKVTVAEMEGVPHHLIDVVAPTDNYTVADFQRTGRQLIEEISHRGHIPIIVGGTGLYVQSLLYDYQLGKVEEINKDVRETYSQLGQKIGKKALWEKLEQVDPLAAEKIHWNNERKVIRALEVFEQTGHSIIQPQEKPVRLYDAFLIGLNTDRQVLYERINQRVHQMIAAGLINEAKTVYELGKVQAAQGIGYKEFFPYFEAKQTLDEVIATIQLNSRRYAKRQLTWFRNRLDVQWFDLISHPEQEKEIMAAAKRWMEE